MRVAALLIAAFLAGCAKPEPAPKPSSTPTFDAHCRSCKQCGGGLLDENGQEQGLCEEGWRLWKEDTRPK
jgi:nitrous oxide reductase accessory protein NosL